MNNQKICQSCVLPETSLFPLNGAGTCRLCNSPSLFKHILKKPDSEKLSQLIEEAKRTGKDRQFDCIVAWSGGRDSTFMLHELVKRHNLRCIAVFGKTPFTPNETIESVHAISEKLKIKLVEVQTPSNHKEIAGYCLKEYLKTRIPILINLACASCKFINKEIFKQARQFGVKTVIYGGNRFEYFPLGPASIDINSENRYSFLKMVQDNILRLMKGMGILITSPALLKYCYTFFKPSVPYVNQYTVYLRVRYPDIFRFDYYHFADWDESKINIVLNDLGWKLPSGCNSTWRADCVFEAVKNTAFKNQLGFTYAQAMYSNLIRGGKIARDEALIRLEKEGISEPRLHKALELCGLTKDAFDMKKG
jgi:PP-loop superfamily ATP-utilizing enzyme